MTDNPPTDTTLHAARERAREVRDLYEVLEQRINAAGSGAFTS